MPVSNDEIAEVFENMAVLLEMKGDTVFKIRAYQRAARTISQLSFALEPAVQEGVDLRKIPGIGKAISDKTREYLETGRVDAYDRLLAELPDGILTLLTIPGIGTKTAMLISQELGVSTVEGIEKAIYDGRLAALPRLGATHRRQHPASYPIPHRQTGARPPRLGLGGRRGNHRFPASPRPA